MSKILDELLGMLAGEDKDGLIPDENGVKPRTVERSKMLRDKVVESLSKMDVDKDKDEFAFYRVDTRRKSTGELDSKHLLGWVPPWAEEDQVMLGLVMRHNDDLPNAVVALTTGQELAHPDGDLDTDTKGNLAKVFEMSDQMLTLYSLLTCSQDKETFELALKWLDGTQEQKDNEETGAFTSLTLAAMCIPNFKPEMLNG